MNSTLTKILLGVAIAIIVCLNVGFSIHPIGAMQAAVYYFGGLLGGVIFGVVLLTIPRQAAIWILLIIDIAISAVIYKSEGLRPALIMLASFAIMPLAFDLHRSKHGE